MGENKEGAGSLKVTGIDVSFLEDGKIFDFWYDKMPVSRRQKIDLVKPLKGKLLSLGAGILFTEGLKKLGLEGAEIGLLENKKPYIIGADGLYFNLSHSGGMAVCAFSDSEVGIDIEKNKEFKDSLVDYVFDDREKEFVSRLSDDDNKRNALFTSIWTMKESIMKFTGKGISMVPKSIFVDLSAADNMGDMSVAAIYHNGKLIPELKLSTLRIPANPDYQVCVCSKYALSSRDIEMFDHRS
ncbi:MAG: 4'-phosphopantetheinyl transferase superfamily protein [Butyrivibrio sp.]|nr:4'-phosphopantetheinyl transferase superfamily protein [Butyrivibrio sp.]